MNTNDNSWFKKSAQTECSANEDFEMACAYALKPRAIQGGIRRRHEVCQSAKPSDLRKLGDAAYRLAMAIEGEIERLRKIVRAKLSKSQLFCASCEDRLPEPLAVERDGVFYCTESCAEMGECCE